MIRRCLFGLILMLGGAAIASCSDAETAIDCAGICNRYSDCFEEDYDVEACTDRCTDEADGDRDFRDKADSCNTCLGDRSCADSFLSCTDNCLGVVP